MAEYVPIYRYTIMYASEHGELPEYRASYHANVACKKAIDAAITKYYKNNILPKDAMREVVSEFGYDRTLFVLGNTVRQKDWDKWFSDDNRRWAEEYPAEPEISVINDVKAMDYIANSHPCLLDIFMRQVREEYVLALQPPHGSQIGMM